MVQTQANGYVIRVPISGGATVPGLLIAVVPFTGHSVRSNPKIPVMSN